MALTCCPKGSTYIDSTGHFTDPFWGAGLIVNPDPTSYFGKCVTIVNNGWAILQDPPPDPIECSCCPEGFSYSSYIGICLDDLKHTTRMATVPCIPCICVVDPPPPDCETCEEASGLTISFAINPFIKQCVDCLPLDSPTSKDCELNRFIAYPLIQPNTNNFNLES